MSNNYTDTLIDYIDNNLSDNERVNISTMLKQNTAVQNELDNLLLAKSAVQYYGIKQQVAAMHKEMMPIVSDQKLIIKKQSTLRIMTKWSMRIAASVLVIALGIAAYTYTSTTADNLYADNYTAYTFGVNRGEVATNNFETAFAAKDYATVIKEFPALQNPTQKEIFMLGQANIETKNYTKAIDCVMEVLAKNKSQLSTSFNDDAEYYLAWSYLKNNMLDTATALFEGIQNNKNHLYNDKVNNAFIRSLKILSWKKK
jgi:tetratricopeptide (TPR) repeat protein